MRAVKTSLITSLIALPFLITPFASAKSAKPTTDQELNMQAYEKLLHTDINSKREAIVTTIMNLDDNDAKAFWPIYKDYDAERAKLDDAEAQLTNDYVKNYQSISDDQADHFLSKSLELEEERAELKKKYYDTMKKSLSAATAAKFFEVDSQIQHVYDLQLAAKLPANQ
jgi:hypothetical protein